MLGYLLIFLVILITYLFFFVRYLHWRNRDVPYEKPAFFFGSMYKMLTFTYSLSTICGNLYRKYDQCRYVGFFNFWTPALVLRDTEMIKEVLIKQFKSFRNWIQVPDHVDSLLSLNLFVLHGDQWKNIRNNLGCQFTFMKVKSMLPHMSSSNGKMVQYIQSQMRGGFAPVNANELGLRFTVENVYSCAYGLEAGSFSEATWQVYEKMFVKATSTQIKQLISVLFPTIGNIMKYTIFGDPISSTWKNFVKDVVKFRVENMVDTNDFLGHLIKLRAKGVPAFISDDQLACHALSFFLDGTQTTAGAFAYILFELAKNPSHQDRARHEVDVVLQKYNDEITSETLQDLKYMDAIILETFRLHTIVKLLGRVCLEDVTFPLPHYGMNGKKVTIKKGTQIFMPIDQFYQDAKFYSKPTEFNPDRFQDSTQNVFEFGDGPKMCIGKPFALAQLKMGLTAILSNYTIELNKNVKLPLQKAFSHMFDIPESHIWINFVNRS